MNFSEIHLRNRVNSWIRTFHRTIQSVGATGGVYKGQGRIQRELMTHAYKAFLVQDARLQSSIPSTMQFSRFPKPFGQGAALVACIIVARVRPRTSKGITDLLLPYTSIRCTRIVPLRSQIWTLKPRKLVSRLRSRSLTELTRQITPPTKNGHAPPPIESRKSSQSVNPSYVRTW